MTLLDLKKPVRALVAAAAAASLFACFESGSDAPEDNAYDAAPILSDLGEKVILATYADLSAKSLGLSAAVADFDADPSEANLEKARDAWKAARRPWEQAEGFLFGPVDSKGIDPSIDSWPLNAADLDGVLASGDALTKAYVDALGDDVKGFHTIEYLLFGNTPETGEPKAAADVTVRQREFLRAATASFADRTALLHSSWAPSGENFLANLKAIGPGKLYASQSAALQEIVNGMIGICGEVGDTKIAEPFKSGDRKDEESSFSDNSNQDFADNIRSIRNLYLGEYGNSQGKGLTEMVTTLDGPLDTRIKAEIESAISAIQAMTPTFGDAITRNKPKVEAAQAAVKKLAVTLESELLPLVSG